MRGCALLIACCEVAYVVVYWCSLKEHKLYDFMKTVTGQFFLDMRVPTILQ